MFTLLHLLQVVLPKKTSIFLRLKKEWIYTYTQENLQQTKQQQQAKITFSLHAQFSTAL